MSETIEQAVNAVEERLEAAVKKHAEQVQESGKAAEQAREEVKRLSEEYKSLIEEKDGLAERLKGIEQQAAEGFRGAGQERQKGWGETFVESDAFAQFKSGGSGRARIDVKNTILGESGSPQNPSDTLVAQDRLPGIVPGAFRALSVLDFVPMGATASNQIEYTREASWTSNAAETAEGLAKPQSDLTFELISDPVRTIAHWLKVSKQVMDDAPALSSYIDRRLRHGVRQKLQRQILQGNGTSPNISGLNQTGRHTDFTPSTGENQFDSINRAKYAVIGADYQPNFIMLNPADWGAMERLKVGSSDDRYLAGSAQAALSYIQNGLVPLIWGLPVVASNDVESGKFFLGDSNAMQLFMRQGATVEMFEQDDTNVQSNLITIRAELRAALAVFTPAAIQYGDLTL